MNKIFSSCPQKNNFIKIKFITVGVFVVFLLNNKVFAGSRAYQTFNQSSWGGVSSTSLQATASQNQNDWTNYSTSTGLVVGSDIRIASTSLSFNEDGSTSTNPNNTIISGGGFYNSLDATSSISFVRNDYDAGILHPFKIAFDPSTNSIWVTNNGNNEETGQISKINANTGAVIGVYDTPTPRGIIYVPAASSTDFASIWVLSSYHSVSKFKASDGSFIDSYNVGFSGTQFLTYDSKDHSIWVAEANTPHITKVDANTGNVIGSYNIDISMWSSGDLVYDPATDSIWVSSSNWNKVVKINASTGGMVGSYDVDSSTSHGIAFDPLTNSVWVSGYDTGTINKFDAVTGTLIGNYSVGTNPYELAYDPINKSIWVTDEGVSSQNLIRVDLITGSIISKYDVFGTPAGVVFDHYTGSIWTGGNNDPQNITKTSFGSTNNHTNVSDVGMGARVGIRPSNITPVNVMMSTRQDAYLNTGYGAAIQDTVIDSSSNVVWTIGSGSFNALKKINIDTGDLIGTYLTQADGYNPYFLTKDLHDNSIWVSSYCITSECGSISKIDSSDGSVLATSSVAFGRTAYDLYTNSLWIADVSSNSIVKIDADTLNVTGTYGVGGIPHNIVYDRNGNYIWTTVGTSTLVKIKAEDGSIIGSYQTIMTPTDLLFDPVTNSIWMTNYGSTTITKIDANNGNIIGTYGDFLGAGSFKATFDPSTNSIWTTNPSASWVSKIDIFTGNVVSTYSVSSVPYYIHFDNKNNSIISISPIGYLTKLKVPSLVSNSISETVVASTTSPTPSYYIVTSTTTNTLASNVTNYNLNKHLTGIVYDYSTNSVWTTNPADNTLTRVDVATGNVTGTYTVGNNLEAMTYDPASNSIWVINNNDKISKLNTKTGEILGTYYVGANTRSVGYDAYSNSIWIARGPNVITKIDASNGTVIGNYNTGNSPSGVAFNPNNHTVWTANYSDNTVTALNEDGTLFGTFATGNGPLDVIYDKVTNSMWTANSGSDNVVKMDENGNIIGAYPSLPGSVMLISDPSDSTILVSSWFFNKIVKINALTGSLIGTYDAQSPSQFTFDPYTNSVWYSAYYYTDSLVKIKTGDITYYPSGDFTSAPINMGEHLIDSTVSWDYIDYGQTITIKARSSNTEDFSSATDWSSCSYISNGAVLSSGNCINNGDHYVQYKAFFSTSNSSLTPLLNSISINYSYYNLSGELLSSIYDTEDDSNAISNVFWVESGTTTSDNIKFQVRVASTSNDIENASWCGLGLVCDGTSYFTDHNGGVTLPALPIGHPLLNESGERYFQYKIIMSSGGTSTPILSSSGIQYSFNVQNNPPVIDNTFGVNGLLVSQSSTTDETLGTVGISYRAIDPNSSSENNGGTITATYEYNIGAGWVSIPLSDIVGSTTNSIDNSSYTSYSVNWLASSTLQDYYSSNVQIRVTLNDNALADNITTVTSDYFSLDTQAPIIIAKLDSVLNKIDLNISDNNQLQYRLCNDQNFPISDSQGNNCTWSLFVDNASTSLSWNTLTDQQGNKTVYIEAQDIFGNVVTRTIVNPPAPTNFNYSDLSDPMNNVYQEVLNWSVFQATTSSTFESYKLYKSTDGVNYSIIAVINNPDINYYKDVIVSSTSSTQYYKVVVTTQEGNSSPFSEVISDIPNGTGGESNSQDTTPPVINPNSILVSNISNSQATITFTTDEIASGIIQYQAVGDSGWITATTTSYSTNQSIIITGLQPNTNYNIRVAATDLADNTSNFIDGPSFSTESGPLVSSVTVASVSSAGAIIEWNTSTSSDSYVYYSTNPDLSNPISIGTSFQVECASAGVCGHSVTIPNPTPGQTYYFYVKSTDVFGDVVIDNNNNSYYSFALNIDNSQPNISDISVPVISSVAAVIVWQTDKPATTQVQWGTTSGNLNRTTVLDSTKSIYHVVALSSDTSDTNSLKQELTPSTPYYFKVFSGEDSNNATSSSEQTFSTTDAGEVKIVNVSAGGGGGGYVPAPVIDNTPPVITTATTTKVGAFDATVSVTANKGVIAFVSYGDSSMNYSSTEGSEDFNVIKVIRLKRLQMGTTYHYKIKVTDTNGNSSYSGDNTFTTLFASEASSDNTTVDTSTYIQNQIEEVIASSMPSLTIPYISAPVVSKITESSATVKWITNTNTVGSLLYSNSTDYLSTKKYSLNIPAGDGKTTEHTVYLSNLEPNTTYHIQAMGYVLPQLVGTSTDVIFTTRTAKLEPSIVESTTNSFTIAWNTKEQSTSVVEYQNVATGETNSIVDASKKTYHNIVVKGLPPGTTYSVRVSGVNSSGDYLIAGSKILVTTPYDVTPPVIKNLKVDNALVPGRTDIIQTIVGWQTNEPASSVVYYEEGVGSLSTSTSELANKVEYLKDYSMDHIIVLPSLKPNTVYRIKIVSSDRSGNTRTLGPNTIITPNKTESILDIIFKNFEETFKFLRMPGH